MTFLNKIVNFINKDTSQNNESKKMTVLIRIMTFLCCAFVILLLGFSLYNRVPHGVVCNLCMLAMFVVVLFISYKANRKVTVWAYIIATIIWCNAALWMYGWYCGMQTLVIQLIIIYYFSDYGRPLRKLCFSAFIFYIYMELYFEFAHSNTVAELSVFQATLLRVCNILFLIICLSILAYVFSNDSQDMEAKLVEYNKKLEKKSNTDPLTGLYNRGKAMDILYEMERRAGEDIFCMCICDIDFFKRVNDNYGHDVGDKVLIGVANVFTRVMDGKGYVARWGGEEFMLIFPKMNGDNASAIVYKIQNEISKMQVVSGDEIIKVTLTYGLTEYDSNIPLDQNIKDADNKLYKGKDEGRNMLVY